MLRSCFVLGEDAAGEADGIADVVDDPDLHVALLRFERELLEEGEVSGER